MPIHSRSTLVSFPTAVALMLACAGLAGCSPSVKNPVTGQVEFRDGKPLTAGRVIFESTNGTTGFSAEIAEDGSYKVDIANLDTPPGDYVVIITGALSKGIITRDEKGKPTIVEPQVPLIDSKFADSQKSPLKATVEAGENEFLFQVDPPAK